MPESRDDQRIVVVIRSRYRKQGCCTCGWVGERHLSLSSAKIEALLHAADSGCEPGIPLIRHGSIPSVAPHDVREVDDHARPPTIAQPVMMNASPKPVHAAVGAALAEQLVKYRSSRRAVSSSR